MGHKVSPLALRLGINKYWKSRWFFSKNAHVFLEADEVMRKTIEKMFPNAGIVDLVIERKSPLHSKLTIYSAKVGLVIGREGQILRRFTSEVNKKLKKVFEKHKMPLPSLDVDVVEVKRPYSSAAYLAELAAQEFIKGLPARGVLKRLIERAKQSKEVLGVKVRAGGRLDGSTIKRKETIIWGKVPLSKLTADIDYAQKHVLTKYGIIGLKVWLYKGDKTEIPEDALA